MKIILAIVTSLNGKSTKNSQASKIWASKEDQSHFSSLIKQNNLIVMGSNTYLQVKSQIKNSPGKLRIIMTKHPQKYEIETIPNQLEFSADTPKILIKKLEKRGYKNLLLVSGASLNTSFFKQKLINELWLTLEPKIFGTGHNLIDETNLNINLKLLSSRQLNSQGTLLLKYEIV